MAIDDAEIPFDPMQIRLKIHTLRKRVDGLIALMESYGLAVDPPKNGQRPVVEERRPRSRARVARRRKSTKKAELHDAPKPKLADLGVEAITHRGGQAHGKVIVQDLKQQGYLLDVAHPDSNISTALSRDPRVKRVENARNTWALVEKGG
jgi:hypothetical protein